MAKETWKDKKELIDGFRREVELWQELYLDKLDECNQLKAELEALKSR